MGYAGAVSGVLFDDWSSQSGMYSMLLCADCGHSDSSEDLSQGEIDKPAQGNKQGTHDNRLRLFGAYEKRDSVGNNLRERPVGHTPNIASTCSANDNLNRAEQSHLRAIATSARHESDPTALSIVQSSHASLTRRLPLPPQMDVRNNQRTGFTFTADQDFARLSWPVAQHFDALHTGRFASPQQGHMRIHTGTENNFAAHEKLVCSDQSQLIATTTSDANDFGGCSWPVAQCRDASLPRVLPAPPQIYDSTVLGRRPNGMANHSISEKMLWRRTQSAPPRHAVVPTAPPLHQEYRSCANRCYRGMRRKSLRHSRLRLDRRRAPAGRPSPLRGCSFDDISCTYYPSLDVAQTARSNSGINDVDSDWTYDCDASQEGVCQSNGSPNAQQGMRPSVVELAQGCSNVSVRAITPISMAALSEHLWRELSLARQTPPSSIQSSPFHAIKDMFDETPTSAIEHRDSTDVCAMVESTNSSDSVNVVLTRKISQATPQTVFEEALVLNNVERLEENDDLEFIEPELDTAELWEKTAKEVEPTEVDTTFITCVENDDEAGDDSFFKFHSSRIHSPTPWWSDDDNQESYTDASISECHYDFSRQNSIELSPPAAWSEDQKSSPPCSNFPFTMHAPTPAVFW